MDEALPDCPGNDCDCPPIFGSNRRNFLRLAGVGTIALLRARFPVMAGPFAPSEFDSGVPADKKLSPGWIASLYERGTPTVYQGAALNPIGMPVGGIGAGQLYLGGDGKLWHWDIFNQNFGTGDAHYVDPLKPQSPLEQGFGLLVGGKIRRLDKSGFNDIRFQGQYPVGTVRYADDAVPLAVTLEAFSPFIPLSTDDSSLPATILRFTIKNTSDKTVETILLGWLENAVCRYTPGAINSRYNRIRREMHHTRLDCSASLMQQRPDAAPDVVFEDWHSPTYENWTVEGTAFGKGPILRKDIPDYQGDVSGDTDRVVNSHASAAGRGLARDNDTGKLTSRAFALTHDYIRFWIGGGNHPDKTCLRVVVEGKGVASVTGAANNRMELTTVDVRPYRGKQAIIEIVDAAQGNWGNIGVGRITLTDMPLGTTSPADFGTMSLSLLGEATYASAYGKPGMITQDPTLKALALPGEMLVGALGHDLKLSPGETTRIDFVLAWHFPHLSLPQTELKNVGRHYASRFPGAAAVIEHIVANFDRLTRQTLLWRDTWYDSTLPHWFLDRTFANTSTLATSTSYRFADGRFYGWEGVGCCPGTCTHVWHYEQAMGRLFPDLDIALRERVDYNPKVAFHPDGYIGFRGEFGGAAVDGQAGTVLRTYRDHQMSPDDTFLKRNWASIKKAIEWMMAQPGGEEGIWDGGQNNTLDAEWFGPIAWLSGLYLAALQAGENMARDAGDTDFARRCRALRESGQKQFVPRLFNGEYFINRVRPDHRDAINSGTGCEIDQVLGQSWAFQVGLGRILPEQETRQALGALWKYNFAPDAGTYRKQRGPGRIYAMEGEAGLLMCTFPRADWDYKRASGKGPEFAAGYFNECMTGFEHQVAGHMLWEGMVQEGLAVERAIHDRYHALRRNPWNEVECGDHYARAMASYGVFVAACGYEYHGPNGHLAFAPRLSPQNFKAAFTAAEGWGSYLQQSSPERFHAQVDVKWGKLDLQTLGIVPTLTPASRTIKAMVDGKPIAAKLIFADKRFHIVFAPHLRLQAYQTLDVTLT